MDATTTLPVHADKENAAPSAEDPAEMRWKGADGRAKLRKVIKSDVESADAPAPRVAVSAPETLNDYEREREVRRSPLSHRETRRSPTRARRSPPLWPHPSQERIARNKLVLQGLKLKETARALESTVASAAAANADAAASRPRERKPKAPPPPPRPKSTRATRARSFSEYAPPDARDVLVPELLSLDDPDDPAHANHLTCDAWCEREGITPGPKMTGHYEGWVSDAARVGMGLADSAAEAWEQNGGGRFERKPAKGESAKEFARRMMKKNPNAYFYRHNPPGEDAWHGDWSEDEIRNFVDVAKSHGCGDKWGLFASHVPHRVGYQCSAVYRQVIIPRGLLRDDNFVLDKSGKAIWVGTRGGR